MRVTAGDSPDRVLAPAVGALHPRGVASDERPAEPTVGPDVARDQALDDGPGGRHHSGVDFAASGFGADASPDVRSTFSFGDRVHWRARFGSPARTARVDMVTVIRDPQGWERVVSGHELWLAHPSAVDYAGWLDAAAYRSPGRFVLRFVRGADVLAEGEFEVVPSSSTDIVH